MTTFMGVEDLERVDLMKQNWFLLGDIHGDAGPIEYFYHQKKEPLALDACENFMILLGDVGCNYALEGMRDYNVKKRLSNLPFTYLCLRGNHEARVSDVVNNNPEQWEPLHKYGGIVWVEKEFPKIEYLEDGPAVYEFAGYKTLTVPGAYSIDKWTRLYHQWPWFANEQLSEQEQEYGRELVKRETAFDLILSHTCPIAFEPRDLFLGFVDQSQVDKTMEIYLGELEATTKYRRWAWGHFHGDRLYPWEGDREKLMLFNENVVDLIKFMEMSRSDYLEDLLA